ncbi:cobyric acid synthase [Desulfobaculum sp. SPO524]|uniref:cobyric acid synthase n=1 Tax=Desulfobaculum sp. SPO524 TaxID=3378071 RepID=UPI003854B517
MQQNRHGGNIWELARRAGCAPEDITDFSANINPLGPPWWFRAEVSARLSGLAHYPEPHCDSLCAAAAQRFGITPDEVLAGNGSTEVLHAVLAALRPPRAIIPVPAYSDYRHACEVADIPVTTIALKQGAGFMPDVQAIAAALVDAPEGTAVFIGQPNNPTGRTMAPQALRDMAGEHPSALFIVDEAFADFVPELDRLAASRPQNVVVLHSLTKFYAIPGLRLGLGYAAPDVAARIRRRIPNWSVNGLAQAVGLRALADEDYARRTVEQTAALRTELFEALCELDGLSVLSGEANFLLCRVDAPGCDAQAVAERCIAERVAIRVCHNFEALDECWLRVAVRTRKENAQLVAALTRALPRAVDAATAPRIILPRKTPAIMMQGTSSNAGKSVLAAALCRVLLQDGYDVAPYKAQNMSLNSYVTREGGEMGRAQVTQAQACRLDPDVRMNPVLLKPSSDTGSQVIVCGSPVGNMDITKYMHYKREAAARARDAYDSLSSEHEVMVLEGAGSPAEINLKRHDMVNMAMARYAEARVLLVGDIDRGGVFASFVGTMELLEEWERDLVAGYVINMFRGDASLLRDALDYTTARTGKPFYGVVPYLAGHGLPEEDSVSFKSGVLHGARTQEQVVDIACIDLPHISNFTDMDALGVEPDVHMRVVRRPADLGRPDAVILPGSKNVVADSHWLDQSGLAEAITALAREGKTEIIGICGGFQMLGAGISDPHGIESAGETLQGLGLLPIRTELAAEKTLTATGAQHLPTGEALTGYEIHHGRTVLEGDAASACVTRDDGEAIGFAARSGRVWGSYLHGVFDADAFRRRFVDDLRQRGGHAPLGKVVAAYDIEPALDRLADAVRASVDMKALYKNAGLT